MDAVGGDFAPGAPVEGSVSASKESDARMLLLGPEENVRGELRRFNHDPSRIEIMDAPDLITMDDPASVSIRKKRKSSITIAAKLLKEGKIDGFVSAGNTGAVVAAMTVFVRTLEGIDRPALASFLPTRRGTAILLDVGANAECKPNNLLQFAKMGELYYKEIFGRESPRIGLLSIGEEESKGNDLTKQVYKYLKDSNMNFVGNVEGRHVFDGEVEIIVCDGFTGNVALKMMEGLSEIVVSFLREELSSSWVSKFGFVLSSKAYRNLRKRTDYSEYGGVPLLGIKGVSIICHGRSSAKAIKSAIKVATEFCRKKFVERVQQNVRSLMSDVDREAVLGR